MKNTLGRKSKFSWTKSIVLFLSFLLVISTLGISLSLFRDNTKDEQSNDFAPTVLSDNSFNTLKSSISFDMAGNSILVQPVSFTIATSSSSVYVRAYVKLDGTANDARQKIAYEALSSSSQIVEGGGYNWVRFGEYYYLCDTSNQLATLTSANSGQVFNLLEKENNIVPNDIVDQKFESGENVGLSVTLQSVQTSRVSSKNVETAHSAFNSVETSLANTKSQCQVYFYDANGLSLGSQTVAYGKGVNIPTPASQSGKELVGWNTKSDYTGATLDAEDLASVYEDLVLYAEFDALTYNVTVIQPTGEHENSIGTITPSSTTMRYGESLTFKVVPKTNYYIFGVYIRNEQTKQVKNVGSVSEFVVKDYSSDITIWADISQEVVFLDINGGTGSQPKITFNEDKTKFVLSETEPVGPDGKEFYYYSTNPLDNEQGQNGIRIDLGVEYPLSYLDGNKTLYAIYLTPTTNYTTAANYIVVPKTVTAVEGSGTQNMFSNDSADVKFVTLPRQVKEIGAGAFRNLDELTGLSMSTVVNKIGAYAFENCSSMTHFDFGPFVNTIGEGAFKNCVSLSILNNFDSIPTTEFVGTFEGCSMLISVTLPSGTTKIEGTFKNCNSLMEIVLPEGLRNIGESTFENCTSLSSIDMPSSVSFFGAKAFRNCVALTKVENFVDVVAVEIPDSMFENCVSLSTISIPTNTAIIGQKAFYSCSSLVSIENLSNVKVGKVLSQAFANCSSLEELNFTGSLSVVEGEAFKNSGLKKVVLSSALKSLGVGAFEDCQSLTSLTQLGIITKIEQNTFKNCSSLFNISIPTTVTTICSYAFENCASLTTLTIPASVQTIEVDALKNPAGLVSITMQGDLPADSTYNLASTKKNWYYNTVSTEALSKKGYYTTVVSDWIVQNINGQNYITGYRGDKTSVTIPYTITNEIGETTYIYGVAFRKSSPSLAFENVVIEEGIQAIFNISAENKTDDSVPIEFPCFQEMTSLKSITLPTTLSSISNAAFAGCTNLSEIIGLKNTAVTKLGEPIYYESDSSIVLFGDTITIDGTSYMIQEEVSEYGVFAECTSLKKINLPANLQVIGYTCFVMCTSLKEIEIPASVRAIGMMAFYYDVSLESITGLENCVLDYQMTISGTTIQCGFSTCFYDADMPVFCYLPSLKTLSLPTYATIATSITIAGEDGDMGVLLYGAPLISNCPKLETIIVGGDWPSKFSLVTIEQDEDFGVNSYQWYLNGVPRTYALEAGTYSIYPGSDDSDWVVDEEGYVIAYKGTETSVTVPKSIIQDGHIVEVVGIKSFKNPILASVTLSEGLTTICDGAFKDMTKLTTIKLCDSLTTIGDGAFENCSKLSTIVLPTATKNVGEDIFKNCSLLKLIIINSDITTEQQISNINAGEWFYQANASSSSKSASTILTKGIYSQYQNIATTSEWEVGTYENKNYITAYLGYSKIVTVPALVIESDYSAAYEIYGLLSFKKYNFTSITFSEGIEVIGLEDNGNSDVEMALLSLGLYDAANEACYYPFMYDDVLMSDLQTLVLPQSLQAIGLYGLAGLCLPTNTILEINNIQRTGEYAFAYTTVDEIRLNVASTKDWTLFSGYAFKKSSAQIITLGNGPSIIPCGAFEDCTNLVELNLPNSIISFDKNAFDNCSSLSTLNLKYIRSMSSISGCSSLEKIILGADLNTSMSATSIEGKNGTTWFYESGGSAVSYFNKAGTYWAFAPDLSTLWTYEQVNGLWYITGYTGTSTTLIVPATITTADGDISIKGIKSLNTNEGVSVESLTISDGIEEISENAFSGKTTLKKVVLPTTITSIGANAFNSTSIEVLTLGCESLTLSNGALNGMSELEIINVTTAVNTQYTLPTDKTWTYINASENKTTTTLQSAGIYTTLSNVATTNDWIVVSSNGQYAIAGYRGSYGTASQVELTVPNRVINHITFEIYDISTIKSMLFVNNSNNTEIKLKISEGITSIGIDNSSRSNYTIIDISNSSTTYSNVYYGLNANAGSENYIVSVELPTTLTTLYHWSIYNMAKLTKIINLENTQIVTLDGYAICSCSKLEELHFPKTLTKIASDSYNEYSNFYGCSQLKKITLDSPLLDSFDLEDAGNGIWYYTATSKRVTALKEAGVYTTSQIQNIGLWVVEYNEDDGKYYISAYLGGETDLVVPYELFDDETGNIVQIYGVWSIGKSDRTSITFEEGIEVLGHPEAEKSIFVDECENLETIILPSTLTTVYAPALNNISTENITITILGSLKSQYTLSGIKSTDWYYGSAKSTTMQNIGSYTTMNVVAFMPDEETLDALVNAITGENVATKDDRQTILNTAGYGNIDNAWYIMNFEGGENWYMLGYWGSETEPIVPHYVWDYFSVSGSAILRPIDNFYTLMGLCSINTITKFTLEEGYTHIGGQVDETSEGGGDSIVQAMGDSSALISLKEVVLPSTITSMGMCAFMGATALESVDLSKTQLTSIPMMAFFNTPNLRTLKFPTTLKTLESYALYSSGLVELELNEGLISVDVGSLSALTNLKTLIIPTTLSHIASEAMTSTLSEDVQTLSSLERIIIKKSMTSGLDVKTITQSNFYKDGSQIALSSIGEAGTYLNYLCGIKGTDWQVETSDGKNYITAYLGDEAVVDVPAYVWDGQTEALIEIYGVKSIGKNDVRKLTFREGIQSIGDGSSNLFCDKDNNSLTYVNLPSTLVENTNSFLNNCNVLESINLVGDIPTALEMSSIKKADWYSHSKWLEVVTKLAPSDNGKYLNVYSLGALLSEATDENLQEISNQTKVAEIQAAGGYSIYSLDRNWVVAKPAVDGYGADMWLSESYEAFIPAFALYGNIDDTLVEGEGYVQIVPINSVVTLRKSNGKKSAGTFNYTIYKQQVNLYSLTFAEGITSIGANLSSTTKGAYYSLAANGAIVDSVIKVGSEDKINLLSSTFQSGNTINSLASGTYVFEAMVKSTTGNATLQASFPTTSGGVTGHRSYLSESRNDAGYIYVKFDVQTTANVTLNIKNATCDCISLYRVDKGLPTTLTTLAANAFAQNYDGSTSFTPIGLESINLSQTAVKDIQIHALNGILANLPYEYEIQDGKYMVTIYDYEEDEEKTVEAKLDWSFDSKTNTLTYDGNQITMTQSSDGMFWGSGYTLNAKTNRLTTPSGDVIDGLYYLKDGNLYKDIILAVPQTLKTIGHMGLNTGATHIYGLENTALESIEVGAFGGEMTRDVWVSNLKIQEEYFGTNLVEINLPKTFEDIYVSDAADLIIGQSTIFSMSGLETGITFTYPTNPLGYAFAPSSGLKSINVDPENAVFSSLDGVLFNATQTTLISFPRGRTGAYTMPATVTEVGEASFYGSSISTVTFSLATEKISDYAFIAKIILTSGEEDGVPNNVSEFIDLENTKLKTIGRGAFVGSKLSTLSLPDTLVSMGVPGDEGFVSPIAMSSINLIILRSKLSGAMTFVESVSNEWYFNFSTEVESMQLAGIYSVQKLEKDWKVEQINGKWWIVDYLGDSTNLIVPSATLNDVGEFVEVYGVKSIGKDDIVSIEVSAGVKEFGFAGDSQNILGSTSNSTLVSITFDGSLDAVNEYSLLGLEELSCLTLAADLSEEKSFAPTGKTTWYWYADGVSNVVSTYEKAGIYTSNKLEINSDWVVDSDGYIIEYRGTQTELVVPSHVLTDDNKVVAVRGISSLGTSSALNNVTSVTLSEGIKSIESYGLSNLSNLTEINLCQTLTYIGPRAFSGCSILEEITITGGVQEIDPTALPMDKNLRTITLQNNLQEMFEISSNYGSWFYNNEPTKTDVIYVEGTYKKLAYKLVYDGNGGMTSDDQTTIVVDGILQGKSVVLAENSFTNGTNLFLGWSLTQSALYSDYKAGDIITFITNDDEIEVSDHEVVLYAIWQRSINIATLDTNWTNSKDSDRGYYALQFANSTYISNTVDVDLSKEIILTGSFAVATLGKETKLISLTQNSYGIDLRVNTSNKLELRQNNTVVLTSSSAIATNAGYSYLIYKSYSIIEITVLNSAGEKFYAGSFALTSSNSMTGKSPTYVLGYSSNTSNVTYGTSMVFESTILKGEYLPIEGNTTQMQFINAAGYANQSLQNSSGVAASVLNVVKMIPTSEGSTLPKENVPQRYGYTFGGFLSELGTTIYKTDMTSAVDTYPYIGDKTLVAQWNAIKYTIVYNANGGAGSKTQDVYYDVDFTALGNNNGITRVGYDISAWTTDAAGSTKLYDPNITATFSQKLSGTTTLTLYAQWKAKQYNVTINPNGGSYNNSTNVSTVFGDYLEYTTIADPTRTGYTFAGWIATKTINSAEWMQVLYHNNVAGSELFSTSVNLATTVVNDTFKNSQFATLSKLGLSTYEFLLQYDCATGYNHWTQTSNPATTNDSITGYTAKSISWSGESWGGIALSSHSNTFIDGSPSYGTWWYALGCYSNYQSGIPGPNSIVEQNKVLLWLKTSSINPTVVFKDADALGSDNTYYFKDEAVTLKALWIPNTYTVAYNGNGATNGSTASSSHTYDTAKALTANGFSRVGYTFAGWATSASGNKVYDDKASVKNLTSTSGATVTLYAVWTAKTYTVTINPNGGTYSGSTSAKTVSGAYGKDTTIADPTRTGYTFAGWIATKTINSAEWMQVLYHNNVAGSELFSTSVDLATTVVNEKHKNSQFATLSKLGLSTYEFLLQYDCATGYNHWTQTSNPATTQGSITGYTAKSISWSGSSWGGIAKSADSGSTFIDGSPTTGTNSWWYALGCYTNYNSGIPGPNSIIEKNKVNLWLNTANIKPTSSFKDADALGSNNTYYFKDETVTLKALWIPINYTLTVDSNGGSGGAASSSYYNISTSAQTITLTKPSRTGYTFASWTVSGASGGTATASGTTLSIPAGVYGNLTIKANWTVHTYTIQYYDTYNNTASYSSVTYTYDDTSKTFPSGSLGSPWTFVGWATSSTATSGTYTAGATVNNVTSRNGATIKLYSVYRRTITLSYAGNGATSGSVSSQTNYQYYNRPSVKYTSPTFTLASNGFTKTGYTFSKWDLGAVGATYTYPGNQDATATVTATAQWTVNTYYVSFDPNDGNVSPTAKQVTYDSTYGTLPTPTKAGYTFVNWSTSLFDMGEWLDNYVKYNRGVSGGTATYDRTKLSLSITPNSGSTDTYTATYAHAQNDYTVSVKPSTTYTFSWTQNVSASPSVMIFFRDAETSVWASSMGSARGGNLSNASTLRYYLTFTTKSTTNCLSVRFGMTNTTAITFSEVKLEEGSTATAFEYITSSTTVKTASDHTLYAMWKANAYYATFENHYKTWGYAYNAISGSSWDTSNSAVAVFTAGTATGGSSGPYITGMNNLMTVGLNYRLTFQAKVSAAITLTANVEFGTGSGKSRSISLTTEYQTFSLDFTCSSSSSGALTFYTASWQSGQKFYITNISFAKQVTYDMTYGTLPTPTRTGYTFGGWSYSKNLASSFSQNGWYGSSTTNNLSTGSFTFKVKRSGSDTGSAWRSFYVDVSQYVGTQVTISGKVTAVSSSGGSLTSVSVGQGNTSSFPYHIEGSSDRKQILGSSFSSTVSFSHTCTIIDGTSIMGICICVDITSENGYVNVTFNNLQIEAGDSATEFSPASASSLVTADTIVSTTGDHVLTALWGGNIHKVTLDKQSGTGGTSTVWFMEGVNALYSDSTCSTPLTDQKLVCPTRSGYTFGGYSTSTNISDLVFTNDGAYKPVSSSYDLFAQTSDVTLKALWKTTSEIFVTDGNGTIAGLTTAGRKLAVIDIPTTIGSESITVIGDWAFQDAYNMTSVTIPSSITSIGEAAFYGCTALTQINFNATNCADYDGDEDAFYRAGSDGDGISLIIGEGVTRIPAWLFDTEVIQTDMLKITSVTISSTVTEIGIGAYRFAPYLQEINYNATNCTDLTSPSSLSAAAFYAAGMYVGGATLTVGSGVTRIPAYLFYNSGIKTATISSTVTEIGVYAFAKCQLLTSVTFASGSQLAKIGTQGFGSCTRLTSITIPNTVTYLGPLSARNGVFYGCTSLSSVIFESGCQLTYLGGQLFSGCTALTQINIPSSVTKIYSQAFIGCTALISITIPSSVTSIGTGVFKDCSGMTQIYIPRSVATITASSAANSPFFGWNSSAVIYCGASLKPSNWGTYWYYYASGSVLTVVWGSNGNIGLNSDYNYTELTNGTIAIAKYIGSSTTASIPSTINGKTVSTIYNGCFKGNTTVTSITIPSSITTIGSQAFYGCTGLTQINYNATACADKSSTNRVFYNAGSSNGCTLTIGSGVTTIPNYMFTASKITSVSISSTVTEIGTAAFQNCSKLSSITIPSSVTSIENYAFRGTGLTSITIPSSVTSIGNNPFASCTSLGSITVDSANTAYKSQNNCLLTKDGKTLVAACAGLSSITIPSSVTSIGNYAFYGCSKLTSITIPSSVTSIGTYAFYQCSSLTSITIPSGVTSIGSNTFYGCSKLSSITIPSSVTSIGDYAFDECTSLTAITLPSSLKSIGNAAFALSGLTSITIPSSVTSIGGYAFDECTSLTTITLPSSLKSIASYAFRNCTGLTKVFIPSSVTTITTSSVTASPFYGCSSSLVLYCGASAQPTGWGTYWNNYGSDDDSKLTVVWGQSGLPS